MSSENIVSKGVEETELSSNSDSPVNEDNASMNEKVKTASFQGLMLKNEQK